MNLFKRLRSTEADRSRPVDSPALLSPLQRLRQRTGSDQAGLFADEERAFGGAMALARKWGERHRRGQCGVVVASGGRFDSLIESRATGFSRVPFNDLTAMAAAVDSTTVAVVLEPIQGENIVTPASQAYVQGVANLCRELNILLILNEARGTVGQQGGLLCEDAYGVRADIVVLGDHSNCSPRSAALLARGAACTAVIGELPGWVEEPTSVRPSRPVQPAKPHRQAVPRALMA
ncbi:Aminotransferase class-III [Pseudomonas sp. NFACC02]|uniref:aminotransferase class III-fold pyridoxal phosphate-dependent enzyme n=1 Tax=Pseudomonas sp. NFACC02 TaxID=1566250 RepID=UPI0008B2C2BA|nr:aminotransferase class III-fold pyridoxal phosphate-dependent enzyme [Pseudomonas sp. NFACC02]SER83546.1 Aminotransferase class-III [Pseudomonas sp. NFACC02]